MAVPKNIAVRRIYDEPADQDGYRVLVDRLWPRGLAKSDAVLDEWCKSISPSPDLRKWYGHDPDRFDEFRRRYRDELAEPERTEAVDHLRSESRQHRITLLTATKNPDISAAQVLADLLREQR